MFKKFMGISLIAGLLFLASLPDAQAGVGGSRGSSSSGSGSRGSSGGGSKPSFGGGSTVSKPSFGGGSTSRPSSGGGSSSASSSSKPPSGAGKPPIFGGGSNSTTRGGATDKPSFGGGSTSPPKIVTTAPIAGKTPTSVSKKPVAESFDKLSGTDARKTESRKSYEKSEAPAASYKTPAGKEVPIAKGDKSSEYLRGRLDENRWQNRYQRSDGFYHSYSGRPIVVYNDNYHPMWNYWLLGQTMDVMSLWVYHHQLEMMRQDPARLEYLYGQNADLRARVAALERQGIPRDVTYTPRNVDPDLMYNDNYVNGVYNPKPKVVEEYEYDDDDHHSSVSVGRVLLWIFVFIPLIVLGGFCLYWVVFRYRY